MVHVPDQWRNGISSRLTLLQTALDKLLRKNANSRLSDVEWLQFHSDLVKWISVLQEIVSILESSLVRDHKVESLENLTAEEAESHETTQDSTGDQSNDSFGLLPQPEVKNQEQEDLENSNKTNHKEIGLLGFVVNLNEWAETSKISLNTNIKSLLVRIDSMNTELMKWLSCYLIECAPSQISGQPDLQPGCDQATEVFVTTGLAKREGMANLLHEANTICMMMFNLTEGIRLSVKPILSRLLAENSANQNLQDDMKKIETFISHTENWSEVVGNLLSNAFGMKIDLMKVDIQEVLSNIEINTVELDKTDSQDILGGKGSKNYENLDEKEYAELVDRTNSIQAISFDGNVHSLNLQKIKESREKVSAPMSQETGEKFVVLNTVEELQKQLNESEDLIHTTEKRCSELHEKMLTMGNDLKSKEDENEVLKVEIENLKARLEAQDPTTPSVQMVSNTDLANASRNSNRSSHSASRSNRASKSSTASKNKRSAK